MNTSEEMEPHNYSVSCIFWLQINPSSNNKLRVGGLINFFAEGTKENLLMYKLVVPTSVRFTML